MSITETLANTTWPTDPLERLAAQMPLLKSIDADLKETKKLVRSSRAKSGTGRGRNKGVAVAETDAIDVTTLVKDDLIVIEGQAGTYKFRKLDERGLHVYGGPKGYEKSKTFAAQSKVGRA